MSTTFSKEIQKEKKKMRYDLRWNEAFSPKLRRTQVFSVIISFSLNHAALTESSGATWKLMKKKKKAKRWLSSPRPLCLHAGPGCPQEVAFRATPTTRLSLFHPGALCKSQILPKYLYFTASVPFLWLILEIVFILGKKNNNIVDQEEQAILPN